MDIYEFCNNDKLKKDFSEVIKLISLLFYTAIIFLLMAREVFQR